MQKHCKKHGLLKDDQLVRNGIEHGKQRYKCKLCVKLIKAENYVKNKNKILQSQKLYRSNNPEKIKNIKRQSFNKHKHKYVEHLKKSNKIYNQKRVNELTDSYIIMLLVKSTNLNSNDIPIGLIELKRELIKVNRKIKQIRQKS